jgi:hypothetical protein
LGTATALIAGTVAQAAPLDGLHIPRGAGGTHWNCVCNGQEAGAIWIEDAWHHPIEDPLCRLTHPVQVRDMPAVLYDLDCGENDVADERPGDVRAAGRRDVRDPRGVDGGWGTG